MRPVELGLNNIVLRLTTDQCSVIAEASLKGHYLLTLDILISSSENVARKRPLRLQYQKGSLIKSRAAPIVGTITVGAEILGEFEFFGIQAKLRARIGLLKMRLSLLNLQLQQ
jgi:hypothetical protein